MRWRISFTHEIEGTVFASEPEGLVAAIIGLTRHQDFHSLIKEFKSSMRAYGTNGVQDGRLDWIKNIETVYGPDATISELVEYAPDNFNYLTLYEGEIGIQTIVETLAFDHSLEFTGVQLGYWRKFISRFDVPVNIQSPINLDGEAVTVYSPENLILPTQVLRKTTIFATTEIVGDVGSDTGVTLVVKHGQIGFPTLRSEISDTYDINFQLWDLLSEIIETMVLQEDSVTDELTVSVDGDVIVNASASAGLITAVDVELNVMVNDDIPGVTQIAVVGSSPMSGSVNETLHLSGSDTVPCIKGDMIKIYLTFTFAIDTPANVSYDFNADDMQIDIVQETIFPETNSPGVLIHDLCADVLDRVTDSDKFYSELLGSLQTRARTYPESGCYWNNAVLKGLMLRGYSLAEKQFSIAFKDIWEGINPQMNLGLGYETLDIPSTVVETTIDTIENPTFADASIWYVDGVGKPWVFGSGYVDCFFPSGTGSEELVQDIVTSEPGDYSFVGNFHIGGSGIGSTNLTITIVIKDESDVTIETIIDVHVISGPVDFAITQLFTEVVRAAKIIITASDDGGGPDLQVRILDIQLENTYTTGLPAVQGDFIRIEEKDHFYDDSSMSVLFSGVQRIKRKYSDQYFNSVETGSTKGQIEDISGIDDPQKQTRASIFKNIGRKLQILSTWITQSLTIEQTRRTTRIKSADYKYDNDNFMIEVTQSEASYTTRLDEDYDSVTNLENEATRYNKRWTPARAFLRWSNYIFMGAQAYLGSVYRFVEGVGNYAMTSERKPDDCRDNYNGESLAENADIVVTNDHLYTPVEFEIEHYMSIEDFQIIDANRNLAIGISQFAEDQGGHAAFFITDLQFEIMSGQFKMSGFFKDPFNITTSAQGGTVVQNGKIFDMTFDFSFE